MQRLALQGHLNLSVLYSAVAAFVSHALKIYSGTNNERNTIERQMSKVMLMAGSARLIEEMWHSKAYCRVHPQSVLRHRLDVSGFGWSLFATGVACLSGGEVFLP